MTSPRAKPPKEPAICPGCQAVWRKGRWSQDPVLRRDVQRWQRPVAVLCPACHLIRKGQPAGLLYLVGTFPLRRWDELLHRLRNAEQAAASRNPLERIIRIDDRSPRQVVVETTSEKLARRLGRALNRAYRGTLTIRFSHQDKLVRVYWRRDAEEPVA